MYRYPVRVNDKLLMTTEDGEQNQRRTSKIASRFGEKVLPPPSPSLESSLLPNCQKIIRVIFAIIIADGVKLL
jgi:hypothetical protein